MSRLIQDILECRLAEGQTGVWYLGQEGFLFKSDGKYIVVDPYLSDYVDKNCCQYVEWKRKYAPPVTGEELWFVDAVLCTHAHYDHADPWTLQAIARASKKAVFVLPKPETGNAASYGIAPQRVTGAQADLPFKLGHITVTPIPSAHECFHRDEAGCYRELGYIIDTGSARLFHAGDMCMYDGLPERLKSIDMAFLPVNGRDYYRNKNDIIGNFNCDEAVRLADEIGAGMAVPMHHDLYEVNGVSSAAFTDAVMRISPWLRNNIFAPGERYIFMR